MKKKISELGLIQIVREDTSVRRLFSADPKTEIYINELDLIAIQLIQKEFPTFLSTDLTSLFSVNVISSRMMSSSGYKKIRFYISPIGEIIKKIESV